MSSDEENEEIVWVWRPDAKLWWPAVLIGPTAAEYLEQYVHPISIQKPNERTPQYFTVRYQGYKDRKV